jgi:DNA-nicking Smr family endonuclease
MSQVTLLALQSAQCSIIDTNMTKTSPEDLAFFRSKMAEVKPLKATGKVHFKSKRPAVRAKAKLLSEAEKFPFSDHLRETVTADTRLFFARTGLQERVLRNLRLGKISQTASLDLHGATLEQARGLLSNFLEKCLQQQQRCVRIIHGRGKMSATPLLKNQINNWLRQYPAVLAFCSATSKDGGAGAVYVLLKRLKVPSDGGDLGVG